MTQKDTLRKLEKLMGRLHRYRNDNYVLSILPEEDRLDYKKDLDFVGHVIKTIKRDNIPYFSKTDMAKLNKVWKKYKPKEYVAHA